ncbi:nuclear transport factor 2 family protein [Pseudomaricurvus sp.]|uniref:nuclear transport factor 2 family protein n=1 Tax=Pseudomaricurvus sp. TaxID=2004510 RepID=UPI003F6D37E2
MTTQSQSIENLIAKDAIRDLALLYSRGVDRKDPELLRDLYTKDATDTHGDTFDGTASDYVDFLEKAFPYMPYSGHHVCNHLISVDGDTAEGEVYALAYHILPDGQGGHIEDFMCVRYLDNYQKCDDGRWRFSKRVVTYDVRTQKPTDAKLWDQGEPGYELFQQSLFKRGIRS